MPGDRRGLYYRCYFVKDGHIVGYEDVFSTDDDGAIEQARKLLAAATYQSVELWRGAECVARLDKDSPELRPIKASLEG